MRCVSLFASALPLAGMAAAYPRVDGPQAAGVQLASRAAAAAGKTVIPKDSFNAFDTHWSYNYPWGTDHNGGARMNKAKVSTANDVLTLTASPASGEPPATNGGVQYPVHYLSGTVFAKQQFTVKPGGGYDFEADFKAPVAKGTWPAFWLTAVKGWPPEIDIAEWKGSGKISFNTFNTSSQVAAHDVTYPSPGNWHTIRAQIRTASATDVWVKFFMDGGEITTQYGKNYVNSAFYLIIDLQMEGSSGSPGPSAGTTFQIRNVQVTDYNP
ncbi:hypothetical protein PG989_008607 [Apiospora arundinis]